MFREDQNNDQESIMTNCRPANIEVMLRRELAKLKTDAAHDKLNKSNVIVPTVSSVSKGKLLEYKLHRKKLRK